MELSVDWLLRNWRSAWHASDDCEMGQKKEKKSPDGPFVLPCLARQQRLHRLAERDVGAVNTFAQPGGLPLSLSLSLSLFLASTILTIANLLSSFFPLLSECH